VTEQNNANRLSKKVDLTFPKERGIGDNLGFLSLMKQDVAPSQIECRNRIIDQTHPPTIPKNQRFLGFVRSFGGCDLGCRYSNVESRRGQQVCLKSHGCT
jgi:hypothetical protein